MGPPSTLASWLLVAKWLLDAKISTTGGGQGLRATGAAVAPTPLRPS